MFKGRVKGKTNKQFDYTLQALNPRMAETTPAVFSHEIFVLKSVRDRFSDSSTQKAAK